MKLKNGNVKSEKKKTVSMMKHGMKITLVFAEWEDERLKEEIAEILGEAYEKKRLCEKDND